MVEQRIPNPRVGGSNPSWCAILSFCKNQKESNVEIKWREIVQKLKTYYSHAKDELQKVIFPIKEQVRSAYLSVFIVVTVIALFLALVDLIMSSSISSVMN